MSLEKRVDEMVGRHLAEYQTEVSLAKRLAERMAEHENGPPMPYGYPVGLYRPMHLCRVPKVKQFIAHHGGTLSNGVPKVLGMELVGQYIVGAYNPHHGRTKAKTPRCAILGRQLRPAAAKTR